MRIITKIRYPISFKIQVYLLLGLLLASCATYDLQIKSNEVFTHPEQSDLVHSFYLIGDGGNSALGERTAALKAFTTALDSAAKNSTALFLGDNIYPKGLPVENSKNRLFAEHQLTTQAASANNFEGRTIFIPGNHDWYANGLEGLKRQEKFVENILGKNSFLPENGCPIKKVDISEDIVLVIIDSQWYITNWGNHPTINDDCEIKTRELFFEKYESIIKKAIGKTTIVALHHPIFTNGPHGGQYSLGDHLSPIPVLGTIKNVIRKTGGIINSDNQYNRYRELKKRIITLSKENNKIIFVSGHDHSLQFIIEENLPQIISGSGSKTTATRNMGGGLFSFGAQGYARLDIFENGSSSVHFMEAKSNDIVFQTEIYPMDQINKSYFENDFTKEVAASVYEKEKTEKSKSYRRLWGERYRKYYGMKVKVPNINLDTLYGGLIPVRKGGGHQSKSLRLEDSSGRQYVMRAVEKIADQFVQSTVFKNKYIKDWIDDTFVDDFVSDMFTGAHPFAPLTIATLSSAIGVFHTNPLLGYVPKQNALEKYNTDFGNELYIIEEHAGDGHGDKKSFGYSNKLISTHDMLRSVRKDRNNIIDEKAYIRARLFDMLIGDWDRHPDQWRWAKFEEEKKTVYRPMPRDRDQAFSIMTDGKLLSLSIKLFPNLRLMQSYEEELKNPKWFNLEPFPLDIAILQKSNKSDWDDQVVHIVSNLTDEIIDKAFMHFPEEVRDASVRDIKRKLIGRRANLKKIADEYYKYINRYAIITGTDDDDFVEVERLPESTVVRLFNIKKGVKGELFHNKQYKANDTKEIWIYGLDDDDVFKVYGKGTDLIKVRLIGGQNKDTYDILAGSKVKIYDYKSKKNIFLTNKGNRKLTDNYELNNYDLQKPKYRSNVVLPSIGFNPDDGIKLGLKNVLTNYGFERNPFTSQHIFSGSYFLATKGFEMNYRSEFATIIGNLNLVLEGKFTSPNYTINFFGFGNESINKNEEDEANFNEDFNRVKIRTLSVSPSLVWKGEAGSNVMFSTIFESIDVEDSEGRFINQFYENSGGDTKMSFIGGGLSYNFMNKDNNAFPSLGMDLDVKGGYKHNIDDSYGFAYLIPSFSFDYKLDIEGNLVLASKFKGHFIFGDEFEFYHGASIGANDGLRGYRNQRFTGEKSFYNSTDLRFLLRGNRERFRFLNIGLFGGLDYGRVWMDGEESNSWKNSMGGGVFFSASKLLIGQVSAFNSEEGLRLAFKLGFEF